MLSWSELYLKILLLYISKFNIEGSKIIRSITWKLLKAMNIYNRIRNIKLQINKK